MRHLVGPFPFTYCCTVHSTGAAPTHDLVITQVTSLKTVIFQGYSGNVTATVTNQGGYPENVNVTTYANMTIINTLVNAFAGIGSSIDLNCTWNTTGFARGNYTISAYAWPVPGETNTVDNNFTGGWVYVSMVGNVNGDGKVDGKDLGLVAWCFGSYLGALPPMSWDPNADTNNDGKVDGKDLVLVAYHFGEPHP